MLPFASYDTMTITITKLHPNARVMPQPNTSRLELFACLEQPILLHPGMRKLVPTGIRLQLSETVEAQLYPNRGLAIHHGITILDAPQVIRAEEDQEIQVLLVNLGDKGFSVKPEMAIAELAIVPTYQPEIFWSDEPEQAEANNQALSEPPQAIPDPIHLAMNALSLS
jgi:dUTP pyrophosphatase